MSPEQQEKSLNLVPVKLEPPQTKEEQQEGSLSVVQVKLEHPQIKEQETLFQRLEEGNGPVLTFVAVKIEDDENENIPLASTSIGHMDVCKEEVSPEQERSSSLFQEKPEPPHIKEEQEELLQRPEEPVGSMLTLLAVKTEVEVELESDTTVTEDSDDWSDKSGGVHTGEKPFHCKHCDKRFITSSKMKNHQCIHCKDCDKSFSRAYHLKIHQRLHTTPFHCKHCHKSFNQSNTLKEHQLIHTREKPFLCKHCDKSFRWSSEIKRHQRIHTGEKPFKCNHCNMSFSRSDNLNTHQRIHM